MKNAAVGCSISKHQLSGPKTNSFTAAQLWYNISTEGIFPNRPQFKGGRSHEKSAQHHHRP